MKRWKIVILLTCLLSLLFIVSLFTFNWVGNFLHNKPEQIKLWHDKTQNLFANIKLGMSREEVLQIARRESWNATKIKDSEIVLFTPFEFPAKNWIIIFKFEDGKLISAKVKKEANPDSPYKPIDAPNDINN